MSSTYTVKSGDTFYDIFIIAKKQDEELKYSTFKNANSKIKNYNEIKVGDIINMPSAKKQSGTTTAEPKEGKCGNEFTFKPRGKNATSMQVSCTVNGKSSPALEADQTYILEREKIEESQQGSVDVSIGGKKTTIIDDLSTLKHKIGTHKDVKVDVFLVDKEVMTPIPHVDAFRSPDQQATMTPVELAASQTIHYNNMQSLESLGINVNATEKHTMVAVELPPNIHLDTGEFNIDEMKDEAVEKFTQAMAIAMAPGTKEGISKLGAELFTLGLLPLMGKEKKAFWKQMGLKGKFVISLEKGKRIVQFYPTTHFTASWKKYATKAEQAKMKKGLVKFNKKYTLNHTAFGKQLKQAIPFLVKSKVGYLEKFISGLSRGGTVISIIFIGAADTGKWYMDEKSQSVDLWAIWGVAIATGVAAAVAYNATAALTTAIVVGLTGAAASMVLVVGIGVIASVAVAWAVGELINEYQVKENLIEWLRAIEGREENKVQSIALEGIQKGIL